MKSRREPVAEACAPCDGTPLGADEADRLARAIKVLADPARLRLLSLISQQPEGACGCDLTDPLGLSQPTVSHHLNVLHEAGLLTRERQGVWVCYRVAPEGLVAVTEALSAMASARIEARGHGSRLRTAAARS